MKKQSVIVLMFLMIAIMAVSASALQVSLTSMTLGGSSQNRVSGVTSKFRVTNDGNTTINSITFSDTADAKYNIVYSPTSISNLAANAYVDVTVTGDIPLDFNAVETDESASDYLTAKALQIGTITVAAGSTTKTITLNMQAVNQLEIKKASLECGDKSKNLKDGTEVTELKPDTSCTLYIEVENNFKDKDTNSLKIGDINFRDAEVQILVDDSDFDVDDDDTVDPDPDDYDDTTFEFEIDEEVTDGTYDLIISAIGQDDNYAWHGEQWSIDLKVDRLKHDLQIKNAVMAPEKMDCEGGKLKVDAKVINLGRSDEDDVVVELEIPDLDLSAKRTGLQLDENDYSSISLTLDIPEDAKAGVYVVNLNTYFDGIAPSNTKTFNLAVEACEVEAPKETTTTTTVVTTPTQPTTPTTPATQPAAPSARVRTSEDTGFTGSNAYLGLLGVLIAVIVVIIIVLVVVMLRRPRK